MADENPRELSYGEQLVGVKFNPSGNADVDKVKALLAEAVDIVRKYEQSNDSADRRQMQSTLVNRASNDLLEAQMMAVKAITFGL